MIIQEYSGVVNRVTRDSKVDLDIFTTPTLRSVVDGNVEFVEVN